MDELPQFNTSTFNVIVKMLLGFFRVIKMNGDARCASLFIVHLDAFGCNGLVGGYGNHLVDVVDVATT